MRNLLPRTRNTDDFVAVEALSVLEAPHPGVDPSQSVFCRGMRTLRMMISAEPCAKDRGAHSMTPHELQRAGQVLMIEVCLHRTLITILQQVLGNVAQFLGAG